MRDRQLHTTLHAFAEEAAWTLAAETAGGAEVPFDLLEESSRGGPTLYCYRPGTAGFIADREKAPANLEKWLPPRPAPRPPPRPDRHPRPLRPPRGPAPGR